MLLYGMFPKSIEISPGVRVGSDVVGAGNASFGGLNSVGSGTAIYGEAVQIGKGTTIGHACTLNGPLSIGSYTQLGSCIGVFGAEHPTDVAVPNVNANFIRGEVRRLVAPDPVVIGHGCWIGHGAVILSGSSIGNGAVIGAGSVVKGDIPPYAIAAGSPARVTRHRIPVDFAESLDALAWWNLTAEEMYKHKQLFLLSSVDSPAEFQLALEDALGVPQSQSAPGML